MGEHQSQIKGRRKENRDRKRKERKRWDEKKYREMEGEMKEELREIDR